MSTQAQPPAAPPAVPPAEKPLTIADRFRKGADPDNETKTRRDIPATTPPPAEAPPVAEVPVTTPPPTNTTPPVDAATPPAKPADGAPDPNAGFLPKPNDKETNIANLRAAREAEKARADAAEARARDLEGKVPTDYEEKSKKLEEAYSLLEKYQVEASPRFKEKYDAPAASILTSIEKTLKTSEVDAQSFINTLNSPESKERNQQLDSMIEEMDRFSQTKVTKAVADFDNLREERNKALSAPKDEFNRLQIEQQRGMEERRKQDDAVITEVYETAKAQIPWLKPIEGNEPWNAKVAAVQSRVSQYWTGQNDTRTMAELTVAGAIAPILNEALQVAYAELESVNLQLAEYKGAVPATSAGTSPSAPVAKSDNPGMDFWKTFRETSGIKPGAKG